MTTTSLARRIALSSAAVVSLAGCYTYTPVTQPSPGSTVRVSVPLSSALDGRNGSPETVAVEGRLVSAGDTLAVAVRNLQSYGAYREVVRYDTLRVASAETSAVEVREFSTGRSIVLGTAIAAVATGAAAAAFGWGGGSDHPDKPGGGGPEGSIVVSPSLISTFWGLILR